MRKIKTDELQKEYRKEDLGKGVRGRYFESYKKGTNLVLISPEVAEFFPTEKSVNDVLRSFIAIAKKTRSNTAKGPQKIKMHG